MYRLKLNLSKYMHDVCIYFRRFHLIYLSTNIKNVPRTCVFVIEKDTGIFAVQLVEKSSDNGSFSLHLIFKETLISQDSGVSGGGGGGGGGGQLSFSIETYRTYEFPGWGRTPCHSLGPRMTSMHVSLCKAFKATKNVAGSKFSKGIGVHGH